MTTRESIWLDAERAPNLGDVFVLHGNRAWDVLTYYVWSVDYDEPEFNPMTGEFDPVYYWDLWEGDGFPDGPVCYVQCVI